METVSCNLCGSDNHQLLYQKPDELYFPDEIFNVVECVDCGLGFVNPRPAISEIAKYYPKAFFEAIADYKIKHDLNKTRYPLQEEYLAAIAEKQPTPKLLDIGCANGEFPRYMKSKGWAVSGVEISSEAENITDFTVYPSSLTDIPIDSPTYDAITAWAVIEHVHDPMSYFKKIFRILKPGGLFVFLVPNFDSLASRRLFAEDIPRHLYFFSRKTVSAYCTKSGLKLIRSDYSDKIQSMSPTNALFYYYHRILGKEFKWPLPQSFSGFLRRNNMEAGFQAYLKFALESPVVMVDRLFVTFIERVEKILNIYGIATFVAKKSE